MPAHQRPSPGLPNVVRMSTRQSVSGGGCGDVTAVEPAAAVIADLVRRLYPRPIPAARLS